MRMRNLNDVLNKIDEYLKIMYGKNNSPTRNTWIEWLLNTRKELTKNPYSDTSVLTESDITNTLDSIIPSIIKVL